ncbi:MAG: methyl-accepting chemotaxis protein [Lentisphaerales bacterium]|nr:methyl-accepting chemotaxis protein [Lentisphaerales bacterium]
MTQQLSGLSDIAETTRFLSFNASIEAARSGEAGSAFAVIANDVRVLAANSSDFAAEIHKSISDFENQFASLSQSVNAQEEQTMLMTDHIKSLQASFDKITSIDQARKNLVSQLTSSRV